MLTASEIKNLRANGGVVWRIEITGPDPDMRVPEEVEVVKHDKNKCYDCFLGYALYDTSVTIAKGSCREILYQNHLRSAWLYHSEEAVIDAIIEEMKSGIKELRIIIKHLEERTKKKRTNIRTAYQAIDFLSKRLEDIT